MRWQGTCRSRFAEVTFLVLAVGGGLLALFVDGPLGVLVFLVAPATLAFVEITAQVTDDALRIRYAGGLGWPTTTIRLPEVAGVEAIDVDPWRYGGWGYRGSLRLYRRAAVILRRGPALRLTLRNGRTFVVTVDDADGAAAALRAALGPPGP